VEFWSIFRMSSPPRTNAKLPLRTAKPRYWKLSGYGSASVYCGKSCENTNEINGLFQITDVDLAAHVRKESMKPTQT